MDAHLQHSLDGVQAWIETHNYKGYDPGDGLTSYLRPLTCGNLFAERLLQQAVWKALQEIPLGVTWSYGDLARHVGRAGAARAASARAGSAW